MVISEQTILLAERVGETRRHAWHELERAMMVLGETRIEELITEVVKQVGPRPKRFVPAASHEAGDALLALIAEQLSLAERLFVFVSIEPRPEDEQHVSKLNEAPSDRHATTLAICTTLGISDAYEQAAIASLIPIVGCERSRQALALVVEVERLGGMWLRNGKRMQPLFAVWSEIARVLCQVPSRWWPKRLVASGRHRRPRVSRGTAQMPQVGQDGGVQIVVCGRLRLTHQTAAWTVFETTVPGKVPLHAPSADDLVMTEVVSTYRIVVPAGDDRLVAAVEDGMLFMVMGIPFLDPAVPGLSLLATSIVPVDMLDHA